MYMCIYMCVYMYIYIYIYIYICVCICVYIYIYIHQCAVINMMGTFECVCMQPFTFNLEILDHVYTMERQYYLPYILQD